ncbi:WD40/YVTN/BNR-like repeat-containing protein [Shimazuella kribbensis]|uniref:WD40/YVTN/BNR-like repeat-containing protein n=1 Tax=Shimazuella kribbensis TaxID=139808 RepID=UPI0004027BF8|nr:hypothetical protein [Shimazuella kribbensis]
MKRFFLGMPEELVVVDENGSSYDVQNHLSGIQPTFLTYDPFSPNRIYCGTNKQGLWVSDNGGDSWRKLDQDFSDYAITSILVSSTKKFRGYGVVYIGTELSEIFYSEDGGQTWSRFDVIHSLPSYASWSFPANPATHNVRYITEDYKNGQLYVSIEAGAVIRSKNNGENWMDTKLGHPLDAHTLLTHSKVENRVYAAGSDGVDFPGRSLLMSLDGGESWQTFSDGLNHPYLFSMIADKNDPNTLLVSASLHARDAYDFTSAESYIYRKTGNEPWEIVNLGLPPAKGMMISNLAMDPTTSGTFYALNNQGLYRSTDSGITWSEIPIAWHEKYRNQDAQRRHRSCFLVIDR